ncbi:hypothetical protein [Haloferula sp. BvORR071]|uniref:hypothetical protein n=1 Tax=Haloferula sp. BvORR071 TaxID=1396141 RepID=UPI00054E8F9E|nr:hypothetical protein [Haloferula sp. BvORR071]
MKTSTLTLVALLAVPALAASQTYTNQIRQVQLPTGVDWRVPVDQAGEQLSPLAIDPGGARFELWTTKSGSPAVDYLLDEQYVGTYVPQSQVQIITGDPYTTIPRTRADQPFTVKVTVSGLLTGASDPDASKSVDFLHHVQSYGTGGTGVNLNRTQATLLETTHINLNSPANSPYSYTFAVNQVPGSNRAKVRGEERFTAMSLEDYQVPAQVLGTKFVQIWPVADGTISGITNGQKIRYALPNVTLAVNDVYPDSHTYAQVYKGAPTLGKTGYIVPGSSRIIADTVPQNLSLPLSGYDSVFDSEGDGLWTMELLTATPFGIDRLAYVSFTLDRTIEMNASVTTQE